LEYVSALSNAQFRVGMYETNKIHSADMMIDLNGKNDIAYLVEQVKMYLQMIK